MKTVAKIQRAADILVNSDGKERRGALRKLAQVVFEHHDHGCDDDPLLELFSKELPNEIQRTCALWILRVLADAPMVLDFDSVEPKAAGLFDQVFRYGEIRGLNVDSGSQTYEKINSLTDHMRSLIEEAEAISGAVVDLDQISQHESTMLQFFNRASSRQFLVPLLPRSLMERNRMRSLFRFVRDYVDNIESDPLAHRDAACETLDEFEDEAKEYGSADSERIFGGFVRGMKTAVVDHFETTEANRVPLLGLTPIAKKYPLLRKDTNMVVRVRIENSGTGSARDLKLEWITSDTCLELEIEEAGFGTLRSGETLLFDLPAKVISPESQAQFIAALTWTRLGKIEGKEFVFEIGAQREDVDWETVELSDPYSLEAITTGAELIGRKTEVTQLLRRANSAHVSSALIYGQKRVGKTSLANAIGENLESDESTDWIVVNKGSGDYVSKDANSTLTRLGEALVEGVKVQVPALRHYPDPDFSDGLAPLSIFVDSVLSAGHRLLFILDEFDELPRELLRRTDLSTSLFQPLRQISNKSGCGVILVGGEGMQQLINLQGDRINKFTPMKIDYFSRANDWNDFADLIRRPVSDWLTINDAALEVLFTSSAGNPFFAKLIANQLFADMVDNRFSDASELDMRNAIDTTLATIAGNSFAHFWTDGLFDNEDDADRARIERSSLLISMGLSLRHSNSVNAQTAWDDFVNSSPVAMTSKVYFSVLGEFKQRDILNENDRNEMVVKIPLFGTWLKEKGVSELMTDLRELEVENARLEDVEQTRVKGEELLELSEKWDGFQFKGRRTEPERMRRWLDQFDGVHEQRLMFRMLSNVRVYDANGMRSKMREAFGIVTRNMHTVIESGARVRNDIIVSTLDHSPAKSGMTYCRLFASENKISSEMVYTLEQLSQPGAGLDRVQRLVLIDDFAGTGKTLVEGLRREATLIKALALRGVETILVTVAGYGTARERIERFVKRNGLSVSVYFCDELGSEDRVFSEDSRIFPDLAERSRAQEIAEANGAKLERRHPLGYDRTQAAVVFYQSCPNNALPILWSGNSGWHPMFPRH